MPRRSRHRHIAQYGASGGVPAFVPTDITGSRLWLKADSLALSDGTAVTTWTDSSGAGNDVTQSVAGSKPTYKAGIQNGQPVVRFDGSADHLIKASGAATMLALPITIAVAAKRDTTDAFQKSYVGSVAGVEGQLQIQGVAGVNTIRSYYGTVLADGIPGTSWHVVVFTADAAGSANIYLNGAAPSSGATGTTIAAGDFGVATTAAGQFWDGDIAELLIYDTVLSTGNRDSVESYLGSKYGITVA